MYANTSKKCEIEWAGFDFSIRISELVKYLKSSDKGFPLSERLLICGINIGLSCRKIGTNLDNDLVNDAIELLTEADYIMEMAVVGGYLTKQQGVHVRMDAIEIIKKLKEEL